MSSQPLSASRDSAPDLTRVDLTKGTVDEDPGFCDIVIAQERVVDSAEPIAGMRSYWWIFCGLVIPFGRRNFTNDPWKVCQKRCG